MDLSRNVRDPEKIAELGYKIFRGFYGAQPETPDQEWKRANIAAFARLLDIAFVHMRLKARRDLRKHMLLKRKGVEPAIVEDPRLHLNPHIPIDASLERAQPP